MCLAEKYSNQFIDLCQEVTDEFNRVEKELSKMDLAEQDILHFIENENFNASQGFMYAKKLQEIRRDRRLVKKESATLKNLKDNFINKNYAELKTVSGAILKQEELLQKRINDKKYNPRVIAKEDVLYAQYIN